MTILFCDVKGSTAAASALDPEEWTEIISGAFDYMIQPVNSYDGTVARLTGDGILAFFGAPVAHEDDPQRAVLAGLAITEGVRNYSELIRARWDIDFSVRVGINTGLVVVGAVGSGQRTEYTAMGDAINVAARMEQTAEAGTVQIAQDTFELVNTRFETEDLGPLMIKGKSEPVRAYRVLGQRAFQQAGNASRRYTAGGTRLGVARAGRSNDFAPNKGEAALCASSAMRVSARAGSFERLPVSGKKHNPQTAGTPPPVFPMKPACPMPSFRGCCAAASASRRQMDQKRPAPSWRPTSRSFSPGQRHEASAVLEQVLNISDVRLVSMCCKAKHSKRYCSARCWS